MKSKHYIGVSFLTVLWTVACFVFFQFFYKYHLVYRLDLQLFLYTREYLLSYFGQPAWLSELSGDFLTQFFYFEFGGPLVVSLSVLAVGRLFYNALGKVLLLLFKNGGNKQGLFFGGKLLLTFCLMTWEAFRNCGADYKLASTLSLAGGLLLFLLYLRVPQRFRCSAGIVLLFLSYWMFGYGIWILLLFLLLYEIGLRRILAPVLFVAIAIATPFVLRQAYFLTVKQACQYPAKSFWDTPDFAVEKLLQMDVLSANGQWNDIARLSEHSKLHSGIMAYFYNLSHGIRGDLPEKLMQFPQPGTMGLLLPLNPKMSFLAIWCSNEAWFQMGDMTMAEHSTLLGMIFSPEHRSARLVKRLAEINMINGDSTATLKYIRMLQKTWLYKAWADKRVPGKESETVKVWLERKREFIAKSDTLRDAVYPPLSLRVLLDSNRNNLLALDYLLCYDLLAKDIDSFMLDYDKYKLPLRQVPERLYAEGLLIGLMQRKAPLNEVEQYMIPPSWVTEFSNYTTMYAKDLFGRAYLMNKYSKTYWLYYHFASFNQK